MLATMLRACGMGPPSESSRDFVFDVVEFRDTLVRTNRRQWALTLANVRIMTNAQQLTFYFKPSLTDAGRLIEVNILGAGFELKNFNFPDLNEDRARARLENEAWIQPKSIRPGSVQCAACSEDVVSYPGRPHYDMLSWQDHRDYCLDIKHRIKSYILSSLLPRDREFIHPPNSKDPIEIPPLEVSRNLLEGYPEIREFSGNKEAIKSLLAMYL
ncbi:hypothetical protein F5146DRAFT_1162698 [Armillaria mellea]|nr:hypothetical protein F5146DRAFT_1162698 [Armillaria mellea]